MAARPHALAALLAALCASAFAQAEPRQPAKGPEAPPPPAEEEYDDTAPERIASLEIPDHFPRLCRRFALLLETRHYLMKPLDAEVSRQAWSNYISRLDYDHSFFTQADIESFRKWRDTLDRDLKHGRLDFPVLVFERFRQRLRERYAFVEAFLDGEHDFSADEEYVWKRKDAPWPADEAEQDELWRRRLKNELLSQIASRDFAEIKKKAGAGEGQGAEAPGAPPQPDGSGPSPLAPQPDGSGPSPLAPQPDKSGPSDHSSTSTPTPAPAIDMSPEGVVRRRYKQYLNIVNDADADYVIERFLCAFAEVYDPHSAYMPPTRAEDFDIEMNLTLCGIGATLQSEDGMAKVVKIMPGGPADRDTRDIRLRDGDKIFGVGQGDGPVEDIVHLPLDKIVKRIRGDKGTKVVLHVISAADPSGATTKVVDLIRDDIKLEESAATGRVVRISSPLPAAAAQPGAPAPSGDIDADADEDEPLAPERVFGYVRLPMFYGTMGNPGEPNFRSCTEDIVKIINGFPPETEGMILDLRSNGGGSLREAVTLAGSFIRMGPVVAVRESRGAQPLIDHDPAIAFRKPLVVMIDRASASASEIVAAALQDYGRAVIVGDSKSHGKGTVQSVMPMIASDESYGSLKITVAAFYRVNGRSTQIDGVSSDIVLPSVFEYMEMGEDKLPSALPASRIPPLNYSIAYPIGGLVAGLRAKSEARLADNQEWAKHMRRVERVREITSRTSLPLSYDRRIELLKADSEFDLDSDIDDLGGEAGSESADDSDSKEPEDGIGDDIVLREAFNVLADLCDIQCGTGLSPSQDQNVSDWIYRFFR